MLRSLFDLKLIRGAAADNVKIDMVGLYRFHRLILVSLTNTKWIHPFSATPANKLALGHSFFISCMVSCF